MIPVTDEELRALPHVNCPIAAEYLGMDQNKLRGGIVDGKIPVGYGTRGESGRRSHIWINVEALIKYKHGEIDGAAVQMYADLTARISKLERKITA